METYKKNWLKYALGFLSCLLIRLIPFRPPNIEPILATGMPFGKAYGKFAGFLFSFLSILAFDFFTGTSGVWTFVTASTYGLLGLWSAYYFKSRQASAWNFASFAVIGTLFFDAVTGLSIGPIFFHQSLYSALIGQIPFTLMHLLGNTLFALTLSPALYRYVIENKKLESTYITNIFNPKKI